MQLLNKATQVDFYPVTPAGKRFIKRTIWHPGADSEMTVFDTVGKIDAIYFMNSMIANGAEVTDFNLHCYNGNDYAPMAC
jgi:CubicO group peptidase (beta-lactamase class C family)